MNTETNGHPRSLRNEAEFLPSTVEDVAELHRQLIDAGVSSAVASGICTWTALKAAGRPDPTTPYTRARYRKILAKLEAPEDGPGRGGRHLEPVAARAESAEGPESTFC